MVTAYSVFFMLGHAEPAAFSAMKIYTPGLVEVRRPRPTLLSPQPSTSVTKPEATRWSATFRSSCAKRPTVCGTPPRREKDGGEQR